MAGSLYHFEDVFVSGVLLDEILDLPLEVRARVVPKLRLFESRSDPGLDPLWVSLDLNHLLIGGENALELGEKKHKLLLPLRK